ncbi:hypothetical protein [Rhodococcus globerulus]|uniref:hypothetical protein n=1 Tax=Rhodococcus globerulus TaxID=33008 RepID=UPI001F19969F|nr:hypothetical protein [Rhodococcus globerulus]MCE4267278.1 hypothetical protein [Rhodococcus globerulus]
MVSHGFVVAIGVSIDGISEVLVLRSGAVHPSGFWHVFLIELWALGLFMAIVLILM